MPRVNCPNTYVGRQDIQALLNIQNWADIQQLAHCPLCHAMQLRIFNDTKNGGFWYTCFACGNRGSIINLAAKIWQCSELEALDRLVETTRLPMRTLAAVRVMWLELAATIQANCANLVTDARAAWGKGHSGLAGLCQRLGIPYDSQLQRQASRLGQFVGIADKSRVLQAFEADSPRQRRRANPSFCADDWHGLITIPFHDMPGRFSGWLFIGREGKRPDDWAFRPIGLPAAACDVDTGICMYDVLDRPVVHADVFANRVFVFDDPVWAVGFQAKHLLDCELPVPVVGTYPGTLTRGGITWELQSNSVWGSRPDKQFIFCSTAANAHVFNCAARADGRVVLVADRMPGKYTATAWLQMLDKAAVPWATALDQCLTEAPADVAEALAYGLRLPAHGVSTLLGICSDKTRQLLDQSALPTRTHAVLAMNACVQETSAGWYATTGECVSDARVRIDTIHRAPGTPALCAGRILYGAAEIPYTVPLSTLGTDAATWLRQTVLDATGRLPDVDGTWGLRLLNVARHFSRPRVVRETGVFGWNSELPGFVLPSFSVKLGGAVQIAQARCVDSYAPGQLMPDWQPGLQDGVADLLVYTPQNACFWALLACIGANVLAPAVGQMPIGIILPGPPMAYFGKCITAQCGCHAYNCYAQAGRRARKTAPDVSENRHGWPFFIGLSQNARAHTALICQVHTGQTHNVILCSDLLRASLLAVDAPWRIVYTRAVTGTCAISRAGACILPTWLHRLCSRELSLAGGRNLSYLRRVILDLADMMAPHGDTAVIRNAAKIIKDCTSAKPRALQFGRLIRRLRHHGRLSHKCVRHGDVLTIPKQALLKACADGLDIMPDATRIGQLLSAAGLGCDAGRDIQVSYAIQKRIRARSERSRK